VTRLGYQIPNFTYRTQTPQRCRRDRAWQAVEADNSGFDTVMVMDHFYQLPGLGTPDQEMRSSATRCCRHCQHTSKVRLSALGQGNTYRNPALLAKMITA
jgi:alkanesulfonate monooxygenase SsuD/methylene tetrahydromethanopterin reductase-like flavin-dependent oxidoreductase (luciferase family)